MTQELRMLFNIINTRKMFINAIIFAENLILNFATSMPIYCTKVPTTVVL